MTVKELKELLENLPDDYEVRIFDRLYDDIPIEKESIEVRDKEKKIVL